VVGGDASPLTHREKDGREDRRIACPENPEEAGEDIEARLHPDPRPRELSRNLNSPLLLLSSKLQFASLCSQAPISISNSFMWDQTSNASSCVPGSVLRCSLSSTF